MSQQIFTTINPTTTSGSQLATILVDFKDAMVSGMSGTSRPAALQAGGGWIDTTNGGSPNFYWSYKIYTGSVDIEVFRVNLATGTASISGSDSSFSISKFIGDATAPLLQLVKRRVASNGQVLNGDVLGEVQFIGRTNTSTDPIVARIKVVASDDETTSASGGYLVLEATPTGTAAMAEMARIVDNKMSIGGSFAPVRTMHARGDGIRSERRADDANAGVVEIKKRRISGTGAVQNNDILGSYRFVSTDDASADAITAAIIATATQAHTSTNQGTKLSLMAMKDGANTLFEAVTIQAMADFKVPVKIYAQTLDTQDIPTTASITQLSAGKYIANFTGSTATQILGVDSGGDTKTILIHNGSSANLTLVHASGTATAADRFKLPSGRNIVVKPDSSIELFYHVGDSRWKVKSGAGGGGEAVPFGSESSPRTIAAAVGITTAAGHMDSGAGFNFLVAQGPTAATVVAVSANPQIEAGTIIGQEMVIVGADDDSVIKLNNGNGLSLNGEWNSYKNASLTLRWSGSTWIETARRDV